MHLLRTLLLSLFVLTFSAACSTPRASGDSAIEQLRAMSKARAKIVNEVQDSVVHIKVEKNAAPGGGHGRNSQDPAELFNEELCKKFFPELCPPNGSKKGQRKPHRKHRQEVLF